MDAPAAVTRICHKTRSHTADWYNLEVLLDFFDPTYAHLMQLNRQENDTIAVAKIPLFQILESLCICLCDKCAKLTRIIWALQLCKGKADVSRPLQLSQNCSCSRTTSEPPTWDDCFSTVRFIGGTLLCQALTSSAENLIHSCPNLAQRKMFYLGSETSPRAFCRLYYLKAMTQQVWPCGVFPFKIDKKNFKKCICVHLFLEKCNERLYRYACFSHSTGARTTAMDRTQKLVYSLRKRPVHFLALPKINHGKNQLTAEAKKYFATSYESMARMTDPFHFYQAEATLNYCLAEIPNFFMKFTLLSQSDIFGLWTYKITRSYKSLD